MKKKLVSVLLCTTMLIGMLAGCGNSSADTSSTKETGTETGSESKETSSAENETEGTESVPEGNDETVVLKIATILTTGEPAVNQMEAFAQRVNERSNGSLEVQVYAFFRLVEGRSF